MATGTTTAADLIVPEVWADTLGPLILGRSVFAGLATTDDQLVGQPGDSVTFTRYDYIGDAVDGEEGVAMELTKLSMTDDKATIKEIVKGVSLTDNAVLNALGDPQGQAQQQLATSISRKIDVDLQAAAVDTSNGHAPLTVGGTTAANMSWDAYVSAIALLGDDYDPSDLAGIVIHSQQHAALLRDTAFQSVQTYGQGAVIAGRGFVGTLGSVPIFLSDRITTTGTGASTVYNSLIVKKGALSLKYKRRPIIEKDRDIRARVNVITTNTHYAAKRTDDRGIVVLPTKVTTS